MASRFSGTSSFKPAIDQWITLNVCRFDLSNEKSRHKGFPHLSGSVPPHLSPGWPVCTGPAG